jgi:hypothetical protein
LLLVPQWSDVTPQYPHLLQQSPAMGHIPLPTLPSPQFVVLLPTVEVVVVAEAAIVLVVVVVVVTSARASILKLCHFVTIRFLRVS